MTAFVSVDSLDIHESLDSQILKQDTVATHCITSEGRNLAAILSALSFYHGDASNRDFSSIIHP